MKLNAYEKKKLTYVVAAVVFVLLAVVIYCVNAGFNRNDISVENTGGAVIDEDAEVSAETAAPQNDYVIVHVSGAVISPGVYRIEGSMRVADAIEAAGGFCSNASDDNLNLAEPLADGEKITVLTRKQVKKLNNKASSDKTGENSELININTASKEELMTLPGLGEAKADAVIKYREDNGGFKNTEEIMNISGIKEGVYSKISQYITVE